MVRDLVGEQDVLVSGQVGPMEDGYRAGGITVEQAERYHGRQVATLARAGADLVGAMTMSSWEEGAGVALAGRGAGVPTTVGFTVETDGRLPSGGGLGEAVVAVDAASGGYPAYYTVNCAHPLHFRNVLEEARDGGREWVGRIGEVRLDDDVDDDNDDVNDDNDGD